MKSTGPITVVGKATASRNATTHGLLSSTPVLEGLEDPAEWEAHLHGILDSLAPEGYLETDLADRIARLLWRMKRVVNYETESLNHGLYYARQHAAQIIEMPPDEDEPDEGEDVNLVILRDQIIPNLIPSEKTAQRVMRYEAHLHRQWLQTLHELEAIQIRRRGGSSPLARLDITSGSE